MTQTLLFFITYFFLKYRFWEIDFIKKTLLKIGKFLDFLLFIFKSCVDRKWFIVLTVRAIHFCDRAYVEEYYKIKIKINT